MTTADLTQFDDGMSIQLIGPPGLISVDTLVQTLSGFSEALSAISDIAGADLEVFIDSVVPGSIKIGVRLRKKLTPIVIAMGVGSIIGQVVVNVFSNYLYDQMKTEEKCQIEFSADKVHIKGGTCDITIRRQAYELMPRVEMNPKVANGVRKALQAAKKDPAVEGVGVAKSHMAAPEVYVERAHFDTAIKRLANYRLDYTGQAKLMEAVPETRTQVERTNLIIVKAWLQRGRRKWRFNWRNIAISAAIGDADFFDRLADRSIALHQGDALDADLTIVQRFVPGANVWENVSYTVTKVYTVKVGETQTTIDFAADVTGLPPPAGRKQ